MTFERSTRVLVTGGAGFIGSWLIHKLNERGIEDIVIADFLSADEKWRNLVPLSFADYLDAADLLKALSSGRLGNFDLVLHMGACSSTTELDAGYLMRNNKNEFTRELAEWSLRSGARFVYASSAATYGDGLAGMEDSSDLTYLRRLRPLNMYGYSKHLFDIYAAQSGLLDRCVGVKYFNVFGPNEQHKGEMRSVVNKAYTQILETGSIRLFRSYRNDYRDGEQKRDFVYVKDAAAMTLHRAAAIKREPRIEFIDMPEEMRTNYQYATVADLARLRASGYDSPVTPLADAVGDCVTEYLAKTKLPGTTPPVARDEEA